MEQQSKPEQATTDQGYVQLTVVDAMHAWDAKRCPVCNEVKGSGFPFCRTDWLALPLHLRGWVARGPDDAYFVENFRRAWQFLADLSTRRVRILGNGTPWRYASSAELEAAGFRLIEHSRCEAPGCYEHIDWYWTPAGRRLAVNLRDCRPHTDSCRNPEWFKKVRAQRAAVRASARKKRRA